MDSKRFKTLQTWLLAGRTDLLAYCTRKFAGYMATHQGFDIFKSIFKIVTGKQMCLPIKGKRQVDLKLFKFRFLGHTGLQSA